MFLWGTTDIRHCAVTWLSVGGVNMIAEGRRSGTEQHTGMSGAGAL